MKFFSFLTDLKVDNLNSFSCLRRIFLLESVCASEVELFIVSQHFAAAPFANGNCSEKLLVGEISVLVLGRCHFMNPSLHFICVICRKRTGWLARLIFYVAKYNLVSIRHIWRILLFRRACIREKAISCRVHYGKKWSAGTHCSDKNTEYGKCQALMSSFSAF